MLVQVGDAPSVVVPGSSATAENGEERSPYSELPREGPLAAPGHQGGGCLRPEWPPRVAAIGWTESRDDDGHNDTALCAVLVHVSDAGLTSHPTLPCQHPAARLGPQKSKLGRLSPAQSLPPPRRLGVKPQTPTRFASALGHDDSHAPGRSAAVPSAGSAGPRASHSPQVTSPEVPSLSIRGRHLLSTPYPHIRRVRGRVCACTHVCWWPVSPGTHAPRGQGSESALSLLCPGAYDSGWLTGHLNTRGSWKQPEAGL